MPKRYCPNCEEATKHRKLKKASFLHQCFIAVVARCDLREPDYECVDCGRKSEE